MACAQRGRENRIAAVGMVFLQAVGQRAGLLGLVVGVRGDNQLVLVGCCNLLAGLVLVPLPIAEDQRQSDHETDDNRHAVVAQPLLDAFALFEIVVCHALVTVWISILPRSAGMRRDTKNSRAACHHADKSCKHTRRARPWRRSRASDCESNYLGCATACPSSRAMRKCATCSC